MKKWRELIGEIAIPTEVNLEIEKNLKKGKNKRINQALNALGDEKEDEDPGFFFHLSLAWVGEGLRIIQSSLDYRPILAASYRSSDTAKDLMEGAILEKKYKGVAFTMTIQTVDEERFLCQCKIKKQKIWKKSPRPYRAIIMEGEREKESKILEKGQTSFLCDKKGNYTIKLLGRGNQFLLGMHIQNQR